MRILIGLGIFVGIMVFLAFLPTMLGWVLDPLNSRRIRSHCEAVGVAVLEIKPFPNHYGVSFETNGKKEYAKCRVVGRSIKWKGKAPEEF